MDSASGLYQKTAVGRAARSVVGVSVFAQRFPDLGAAAAVVDAVEVGGVALVGLV